MFSPHSVSCCTLAVQAQCLSFWSIAVGTIFLMISILYNQSLWQWKLANHDSTKYYNNESANMDWLFLTLIALSVMHILSGLLILWGLHVRNFCIHVVGIVFSYPLPLFSILLVVPLAGQIIFTICTVAYLREENNYG